MSCHSRVGLLAVVAAVLLACDDAGPRTPAHIVIAPNLPRVPIGGASQLTVTVVNADGRAIEGEPVTFQSSDVAVLTVSESGLLTSVGPLGASVISAASGDVTAEVEATVVVGPSTLYVSPASLELESGQSASLSITVTDEDGEPIPSAGVLFQTSDPSVADVTTDGRVTGEAPGAATITVSSGEHSRDVLVAVSAP
jgi:uncharacterized protein YjdB